MAYKDSDFTYYARYKKGSGTIIEQSRVLYSAASAADDGEWMDTSGWQSVQIIFDEVSDSVFSVGGSNAATAPANSADGTDIVTALTADGVITLQQHQIPRFIKPHLSTVNSGTANATMKVTRFKADVLTIG